MTDTASNITTPTGSVKSRQGLYPVNSLGHVSPRACLDAGLGVKRKEKMSQDVIFIQVYFTKLG